jgi:hypothetical protein
VPSLFRRKSDDLTADQPADQAADQAAEPAAESAAESTRRARGYTPSKKELGVTTPKRSAAQRRRTAEALPTDRRERAKVLRERERAARSERMAGIRSGDERFLPARDVGPERALVRDIVDARRTAGTWFFVGALVILFASNSRFPPEVRLAANLVWVGLAAAVIIDSVLIAGRIKRLVRERHPDTKQRMGSLYTYGIMRSITFRRMRMPNPRVKLGQKV